MEQMEVEKNENIQTQLQEEYLKSLDALEVGSLVDGTVVQVSNERVFVDVGGKSEGEISALEFSELPEVGDTVSVVVVNKENKHGNVVVSKQQADKNQLWKNLKQAHTNKELVEGTIDKLIKSGYEVDLGYGVKAFLPISQSDSQKVDAPEALLGEKSMFYVERLYADGKSNIVVNRRKYLEELINNNRETFFSTVAVGDIVKGVVKSFTSFGSFIDLGGFDGLLHINDMSWGHEIGRAHV